MSLGTSAKNGLLIKSGHILELAKYITDIANSNTDNDHIHLDDLTIIDKNSNIKELIIEKQDK